VPVRFLLWRLLGGIATVLGVILADRLLAGQLGADLRGRPSAGAGAPAPRSPSPAPDVHLVRAGGALARVHPRALAAAGRGTSLTDAARTGLHHVWAWAPLAGVPAVRLALALTLAAAALVTLTRWRARRRRRYVRLRVEPYRADRASAAAVIAMYESLHKRLLERWWKRLLHGQPSLALEVHRGRCGWLALSCPDGTREQVAAAVRGTYPNCRLAPEPSRPGVPPVVLRLKKSAHFIKRVKILDRFEHDRDPPVNRLLTAMDACGQDAFVQLALTPVPSLFERWAKRLYKRHEAHLAHEPYEGLSSVGDRSVVERAELLGGLDVQHRPLFFADLRVVGPTRRVCEQIASELRAEGAENHLVERATAVRHGLLGLYTRRVRRGEGNPLPGARRGVYSSTELAAIWHLPSTDYANVPFARTTLPLAPASPAILRPADGTGTLRDALGAVTIHPPLRRQNTAVPGTVEQGKSSYLVATFAEDLRRERCAVIVLDPKGDAADAAVSLVPAQRTCTLLDFSHPTCGFNPLAVDAPADVIADYVVGALRNLFTDADIRASSDRYLRNAIIAVLAHDRASTLWDAARLLSVGEDGYAYRARVGARVRALPEFKEISDFFTAELTAQLADARSTTTAKLDAPVNKLARLLNSPSIKRVLLNDSLPVDLDRVIAGCEVLVVRGALGAMGAGNTSVLMQLLVGMLDAALARQQDLLSADERVAVALKVDEAPLVLNRGFADTIALKRSAGLETVACWQTDSQWTDRDVREQLDALFAHRVYFATASVVDAREAAKLMMAEFSDIVRPDIEHLSALGRPDARLRLPKHHAIVSWTTPAGRQPPFVAQTLPLRVDHDRIAMHAARQAQRGGRHRTDLRQPHWDRQPDGRSRGDAGTGPSPVGAAADAPGSGSPGVSQAAGALGVAAVPAAPAAGSSGVAAAMAAPAAHDPAPSEPDGGGGVHLPATPSPSCRELVELDGAHSVRWARRPESPRALTPDPLDLEILTLVASLRHVLTTQIHRRFNAGRAATTTQRRLKRLSDAGLVERFQFHRRDGGGVPMCYVIAPAGLELLRANDRVTGSDEADVGAPREPLSGRPASSVVLPHDGERRLRQARHDVHAAGWALAFEHALGGGLLRLRGPRESVLSPPSHTGPDGRRTAFGPRDLRLPGGRAAHEFLRTDPTGRRIEVERFETVRPDVTIDVPATALRERIGRDAAAGGGAASAIDVLVELDDRLPSGRAAAKVERYDHLLAGWSAHTERYGRRMEATPVVVFVCRDRPRARECARRADHLLSACRAYAGEYPADWDYPGRARILFVSERDAHDGLARAYGVPPLPPDVRIAVAHGDPRAGAATAQPREILPGGPGG